MDQGRIIVIGKNDPHDELVLSKIAEWLRSERGNVEWASRIDESRFEEFDVWSKPERGDAMDAIDDRTALVVALRLYGIDQIPGGRRLPDPRCYDRENGLMLQKCMRVGATLICYGDQPWLWTQDKTQIRSDLYAYEPAERKAVGC